MTHFHGMTVACDVGTGDCRSQITVGGSLGETKENLLMSIRNLHPPHDPCHPCSVDQAIERILGFEGPFTLMLAEGVIFVLQECDSEDIDSQECVENMALELPEISQTYIKRSAMEKAKANVN